MFSTIIPLPKKGDVKQCENYRCKQDPSSDHTGKDPSKDQNKLQTSWQDSDNVRGLESRDQIANLRILMHKAHEHQQPL